MSSQPISSSPHKNAFGFIFWVLTTAHPFSRWVTEAQKQVGNICKILIKMEISEQCSVNTCDFCNVSNKCHLVQNWRNRCGIEISKYSPCIANVTLNISLWFGNFHFEDSKKIEIELLWITISSLWGSNNCDLMNLLKFAVRGFPESFFPIEREFWILNQVSQSSHNGL